VGPVFTKLLQIAAGRSRWHASLRSEHAATPVQSAPGQTSSESQVF
jgi:hypothetical protein